MATERARWTILVYIAAHNDLEQEGRQMGTRSLNQILAVGSTPEVRLAVLYDGPAGAKRCMVREAGQRPVEEPLPDFDSGDGDALLETVRWAYDRCPAEHYGLVLWSHGTGWRPEPGNTRERGGLPAAGGQGSTWSAAELQRIAAAVRGDDEVDEDEALTTERSLTGSPPPQILFRSSVGNILKRDKRERAICFDDGTGHSLDALELQRVMDQVAAAICKPVDLLGMDACLMATLEVAYQVRVSVRYLVASEELVPGTSWPYDAILRELQADPSVSGRELALSVVRHYHDYYEAHPPLPGEGDVTKVALDLSRVEEISLSVDALAQALQADIDNQAAALWAAQKAAAAQEMHGRWLTKFRFHLWDLGSLAARLAAAEGSSPAVKEAAGRVCSALEPGGAVLDEKHRGEWYDGIGGLSIYAALPNKQRISPDYARVALSVDTFWDEMLAAYHDALA
ncbi:MAG: hypothetical protein JXM73_07060 [Anaerolineae bacterium]|nr:hypothetical protein [Anaerolineae bacterium]